MCCGLGKGGCGGEGGGVYEKIMRKVLKWVHHHILK